MVDLALIEEHARPRVQLGGRRNAPRRFPKKMGQG